MYLILSELGCAWFGYVAERHRTTSFDKVLFPHPFAQALGPQETNDSVLPYFKVVIPRALVLGFVGYQRM